MGRNIFVLIFIICFSCGDDVVPKPKGYLRLAYPKAIYIDSKLELPFVFKTNTMATNIISKSLKSDTESYGINLEYPALKGTIHLTYKAVEGNKNNLNKFIRDAEKLTIEHAIKADEMPYERYEDEIRKVYGTFSEIKGNVASPAQFYITDSVNHFLTGSLYFHAKPNYDSILPAAKYLQKDIKKIMESTVWQ